MALIDQVFPDLLVFGRHLVESLDHDPIYPLLKDVIQSSRLDEEEAHWLVWVYLTFYNTSSAWAVFHAFPRPKDARRIKTVMVWEREHRAHLPLNIERRGLRGGQWVVAWRQFFDRVAQPLPTWLDISDLTPVGAYEALWTRVQTVPYVGRWAAFKWLDLLLHALDWPLEAPDMRLAYCSGPRHALEELYVGPDAGGRQDPPYIMYLDQLGSQLRRDLDLHGLRLTYDELETVLCNFHSLCRGRYYVGHDIDEHLENTLHGPGDASPWLAARRRLFRDSLLGELHGWSGVRRPLCRLYRDQGVVYTGAL